jgi:hypothetical protein
VSTAKMAADTAAVFPPAIPGAALMTAFTFVFKTFKDVKADYDRVAGFFNEMGSFLDRISMLETKSPQLEPFQRCVRKVFTGMLGLCGIAADYKGKGRFRKWVKTALDGSSDPQLTGAYGAMEDAISKLGEAVGIATLRTTIEIKETTAIIDGKTDAILTNVSEIKLKADETGRGVSAIREGVEHLDIRMDGVQTSLTTIDKSITTIDTTITRVDSKIDSHQAILISKLDALLMQSSGFAPKKASAGDKKEARRGDTAGANKHRALAQVKRHFADSAETRKKVTAQRADIEESFVKGTASWVFEDEKYKSWIGGSEPVLWLSGNPGVGKTYVAHAIARDLEQHRQSDKTSVACFFFREDNTDLRSFRNALRCSVLQIAEKSSPYCETIAAEIAHDADEEPWKQFFADRFPAKSESQLYLILDGVDEASEDDKTVLLEVLKELTKDKLNVQVLFSGRPELKTALGEFTPSTLDMTRESIASDMKKLAEARIRSLPRVRKFHRQTRKHMEEKLLQKADSMLYIEHMLRRFSAIGRESAVIKDLKKELPDSLEGLYKLMLEECQKGRSEHQYETLRTLFAMLAFSKRGLTLEEAADLIKLTDPDDTFDIEDEVIGRSARILELGRDHNEEDAVEEENSNAEGLDDTPIEDALVQSGKTPLTLQERSLREYFRSMNVEENGLRTTPSKGHLTIFELLVTMLCDKAATGEDEKDPKLRDYATHFWAHHFCEIGIDAISEEQFARGLSSLHRILTNDHNVAKAFETYKPTQYQELDKELGLVEKLKTWLVKAQTNTKLDATVKAWSAKHVEEPKKAFLDLARGHVENWLDSEKMLVCRQVFAYAKSSLLLSGADIQIEAKGKTDIMQVSEYFPGFKQTPQTNRAIGNVLQERPELNQDTIDWCDKGLEMDQQDVLCHFRLLWIKAWCKYQLAWKKNSDAENAEKKDEDEEDEEDGKNGEADEKKEEKEAEVAKDSPVLSGESPGNDGTISTPEKKLDGDEQPSKDQGSEPQEDAKEDAKESGGRKDKKDDSTPRAGDEEAGQ